MKLIHTADVHLGSKIEAKLPEGKAAIRRAEVRETLGRIVRYAAAEGVKAILLCGDVFDSDTPLPGEVDYFLGLVNAYPGVVFFYLRGNHDRTDVLAGRELPNLRRFSDEWTSYLLREGEETVRISGIESTPGNALTRAESLKLDENETNVVLLHGQVSDARGEDKIVIKDLRGKGIDYLAAGHVHSYREEEIDRRGRLVYCGCPEGRGFDEAGEKGFVLLETRQGGVRSTFVPFALRKIVVLPVDLTGAPDRYAAIEKVRAAAGDIDENDLLRIALTGEVAFETEGMEEDVVSTLPGRFFVCAKDETILSIPPESYENSLSLRGEFLRLVKNAPLSEERKNRIVREGLSALAGRK